MGDLPASVQDKIRELLRNDQFVAAKALYDQWIARQGLASALEHVEA